jgi:hypothetical protein
MGIVPLLPSAAEILFVLGLGRSADRFGPSSAEVFSA